MDRWPLTSDLTLHSHADVCRAYWLNDCNCICKNTVEGINTLFSWSRQIWLWPKLTQLFSCIKSAQLWWLWPQMTCCAQRGSTRAWVVGAEWGPFSKRLFTISFNLYSFQNYICFIFSSFSSFNSFIWIMKNNEMFPLGELRGQELFKLFSELS